MNKLILKEIENKLKENDIIISAYLYGSVLSDYFRKDSDIDIALLLKPNVTMNSLERLQVASKLSKICKRDVDIGVLSHNSLIYSTEVISKGNLIFTKDIYISDLFNATTLSMYINLKENSKEVYNEYRAR